MPEEPEAPDYTAMLAAYVEAEDVPADEDTITRAASLAAEAVTTLIGSTTGVPDTARDEAILRTGASVYYRRTARNGIVTFGGESGEITAMRVSKDDLAEARVLLRTWLGWGIA